MAKVMICLFQYLFFITMQMAFQITVDDGLNDDHIQKNDRKKVVHVAKFGTPKELKAIKKINSL